MNSLLVGAAEAAMLFGSPKGEGIAASAAPTFEFHRCRMPGKH
jgi:hypothetical protein